MEFKESGRQLLVKFSILSYFEQPMELGGGYKNHQNVLTQYMKGPQENLEHIIANSLRLDV